MSPVTGQTTVELRVERDGSVAWPLPLVGRWRRSTGEELRFAVDGELLDGEARLPTAGELVVWPRRALGGIVGMHRIVLDVTIGSTRLRLDQQVGPPPYWGISLPGRIDHGSGGYGVRVSIDPLQLVTLWLYLTAVPAVPSPPS